MLISEYLVGPNEFLTCRPFRILFQPQNRALSTMAVSLHYDLTPSNRQVIDMISSISFIKKQ